MFGFFAALAEFERELMKRSGHAPGMAAARAHIERNGGRPYKMTAAKLQLAMASMGKPETKIEDLCAGAGDSASRRWHPASAWTVRRKADGRKLLGTKKA